MTQLPGKKGFRVTGKMLAIGLGIAAAMALPLSASARGHGYGGGGHYGGGYHGGYHGGYGGYHGGYNRGYNRGYDRGYYGNRGHWNGGRWIAGALVTGAVIGLVSDALRPAPVYYNPPVAYSQPGTIIYSNEYPVVTRRVVERRTVIYNDGSDTRYIRDDGYGRDDGYQD